MVGIARALMHPQPPAIKRFQGMSATRLKKIPAISIRIGKDHDGAVNLVARFLQKAHAAGEHGLIVSLKIVRMQEKPDTPTGLVADGKPLRFAISLGKQNSAAISALRLHNQPSFAIAERLIGKAFEPENLAIKRLRPVVIIHDKRDERHTAVLSKGHQPASVSTFFLPRLRMARLTMPISAPPETKASTK